MHFNIKREQLQFLYASRDKDGRIHISQLLSLLLENENPRARWLTCLTSRSVCISFLTRWTLRNPSLRKGRKDLTDAFISRKKDPQPKPKNQPEALRLTLEQTMPL